MSSSKKVLLLGSGGREHAIAWKLSQSLKVQTIYVAPGNGGTALEGSKIINVNLSMNNPSAISEWCHQEHISLVVVGPEAPLANGITDFLQCQQLACFGPCKAAARIEWDKCYGKQLMQKCNIPTAKWKSFTEVHEALKYIASLEMAKYVIKANGLAAGKGVTVCQSQELAKEAVNDILTNNKFDEKKVIIEEYLQGDEISVLAFCDGEKVSIMPYAHDYKRLHEGDIGPNTGGMGAFAPYEKVPHDVVSFIRNEIVVKIISLMKEMGHPYIGVLYVGIILTADGPKVLEFNCRFGDPEAQVLLRLLKNDLYEIMNNCVNQELDDRTIQWYADSIVGVVLAGSGYPGTSQAGFPIFGISEAIDITGIKLFHAATTVDNDKAKG